MGAGCFLGFQAAFKRCFRVRFQTGLRWRGFALSLTLSHGRGDWVVIFPPLVYSEAIFVKCAGCFLAFQAACAFVCRVCRPAFDVSGSLHFGFWGAGCFQVAFGRWARVQANRARMAWIWFCLSSPASSRPTKILNMAPPLRFTKLSDTVSLPMKGRSIM